MDVHMIFAIIRAFLQGFIDSLKGILSVPNIDRKINEKVAYERSRKSESSRQEKYKPPIEVRKGKVLRRVLQCSGLNGGIFWLSICVFEYVLLPLLNWLLIRLLGQSRVATTLWSWLLPALSWTFSAFWVLPLFFLSKVVNTLWCQDIADSAFWCTAGKPPFLTNLSKFFADSLFSVIIQSLFLMQTVIIGFIPMGYVGQILILVHISLLYSLYAFEYRWCKTGWELHKRLMFIETNWPYFIGFGLPLAVCTSLPKSYIQSACCFAVLFPLFIISANDAKPVTNICTFQLQLFSIVVGISNTICNKTLRRTTSVRGGQRSLQTANVK